LNSHYGKQSFQSPKLNGLLFCLSTTLLLLVVLVQGCMSQSTNRQYPGANPIVPHLEKVRKELRPLQFHAAQPFSQDELEYFSYYGLQVHNSEHLFGTFTSGDKVLAAHVFKAEMAKGTVILLHGYFDHSGVWKLLIREMIERGYNVAVYDQPGHGLSSGERADIDDFSEYVSVFEEFLRICEKNLPGPQHLVAHSMGSAIALDYMLNADQTPLDKVVLLAPLVHTSYWNLAKFGHSLGKHLSDSVPRASPKTSSDEEFLEFSRNDPLQAKRVPTKWFSALVEWNKRIVANDPSTLQLMVIQGTEDTTVDWKYNMEFIKEKFPRADILMIEGGGHHLINETLPIRTEVIQIIAQYLEGSAKSAEVD
jgi:alpha-beta hydrolase superfamily lysophospholipase